MRGFRLLQMRRLLLQHAAGLVQLEALREARKAQRRLARDCARAGGIDMCRVEERQEATAREAAAVSERLAASGQAGGRGSSKAWHRRAMVALLAAVAAWSLANRPGLAPSPAAVHHLPRPPGVRFSGSGAPSMVDLRLRWLWLQASPAAELPVVQGAGMGGRSMGWSGRRWRQLWASGWGCLCWAAVSPGRPSACDAARALPDVG